MKKVDKNSIVSIICGMKSNVKLFDLCQIPFSLGSRTFEISHEIDEIIESLNNFNEFEVNEYWSFNKFDDEISLNVRRLEDDGITEFLEKVFGEKCLMMLSTRYCYENLSGDDVAKHRVIWDDDTSEDFFESCIWSDGEPIKSFITKEHYENEILEINESNFLSAEEESQINEYDNDYEKYERLYDANDYMYFIKKSEFNNEKWWLGWSDRFIGF